MAKNEKKKQERFRGARSAVLSLITVLAASLPIQAAPSSNGVEKRAAKVRAEIANLEAEQVRDQGVSSVFLNWYNWNNWGNWGNWNKPWFNFNNWLNC